MITILFRKKNVEKKITKEMTELFLSISLIQRNLYSTKRQFECSIVSVPTLAVISEKIDNKNRIF